MTNPVDKEDMTTFYVLQFAPVQTELAKYRTVDVPTDEIKGLPDEDICERIFTYGQNQYFPSGGRSVGVGDLVDLGHAVYHCDDNSWTKIGGRADA